MDAVCNTEPMKFTDQRGDMVIFLGLENELCGPVVQTLKSISVFGGMTRKQKVGIVQP